MKNIVRYLITAGLSVITGLIILVLFSPAKVHHDSMRPTFHDGDYVIINKLLYKLGDPKKGDIVVVKDSISPQILIKRVVATEGDSIKITIDGKFYIDGVLQEEDYILEQQWYSPALIETVIPEGCIFVMGDNRNNSYDSRYELSMVGSHQLIGEVVFNFSELFK